MSEDSQNNVYEAKEAYQNIDQASTYDAKRFSSFRGKVGDALDKRTLKKALSHIPRKDAAPLQILDIPCGTGRITQFLLAQGESVTGGDISKEMMQIAEKKVSMFENFGGFHQMDASALIFDDKSFDVIVSIRFMGHIPRHVRIDILKEFSRVSQFLIIEYSLKSQIVAVRRRLDNLLKTGNQLPNRWGWHTFEKDELFAEFKEANLQVIKMWAKLPLLSGSAYVLLQSKSEDQQMQ